MKKLSETLQELADHAAEVEKKVAAAEQGTKEKVEAALDTSKANAQARKDDFKAHVKEKQAAAASQWEKLQANYSQQVERIKNNIEAKKEVRERNRAMRRAEDAEFDAEASIEFAIMALDDAEVATLEAIDARAYAESLPGERMATVTSE
jgi:hypothetical protein